MCHLLIAAAFAFHSLQYLFLLLEFFGENFNIRLDVLPNGLIGFTHIAYLRRYVGVQLFDCFLGVRVFLFCCFILD